MKKRLNLVLAHAVLGFRVEQGSMQGKVRVADADACEDVRIDY